MSVSVVVGSGGMLFGVVVVVFLLSLSHIVQGGVFSPFVLSCSGFIRLHLHVRVFVEFVFEFCAGFIGGEACGSLLGHTYFCASVHFVSGVFGRGIFVFLLFLVVEISWCVAGLCCSTCCFWCVLVCCLKLVCFSIKTSSIVLPFPTIAVASVRVFSVVWL